MLLILCIDNQTSVIERYASVQVQEQTQQIKTRNSLSFMCNAQELGLSVIHYSEVMFSIVKKLLGI